MAEIAESAKEGLLALAVGTGLQCDVSQSADSEDRDRLGGSDQGDLDRLVGRHTRARQRHGIAGRRCRLAPAANAAGATAYSGERAR